MINATTSVDTPEREMNRHQRGLVDTCYEEGHYEAGISVLDKLRARHVKPSPAHIQQLIYIALFPPSQPISESNKGKGKEREDLGTPSKIPNATKQNRASLLPTPAATEAARMLLVSFALTNTPEALLRALPCYSLTKTEQASKPDGRTGIGSGRSNAETDENEDSHVAKEATMLKDCKDCWSMLKSGVVKHKEDTKGRNSATTTKRRFDRPDDPEDDEDAEDALSPICQYSWPVLEWLIKLFEMEESLANHSRSEQYSFSLLSQIKPPRMGSGPRWDAETPLDIIFSCYRQTDPRRTHLGARLMSLLINLTNSPIFSPNHLITLTSSRLRALPVNELTAFLCDLPVDGRGPAFKLAICDKYLTDSAGANVRGRPAPKPQARRARPLHTSPQKFFSPDTPASPSKAQSTTGGSPLPWSLPTTSRIVQLLDRDFRSTHMSPSHCFVLFHLFMTFGSLKALEHSEDHNLDDAWIRVLKDEQLEKKISHCLSSDTVNVNEEGKLDGMREILKGAFVRWRQVMYGSRSEDQAMI